MEAVEQNEYEVGGVSVCRSHLDEEVARLHLDHLGGETHAIDAQTGRNTWVLPVDGLTTGTLSVLRLLFRHSKRQVAPVYWKACRRGRNTYIFYKFTMRTFGILK